ncbi:FeoB small GTPase domain-containing protein [Halothermothrix orenii]|uniref:Ferrous iron transport protein FeoB n=1 Tax=Halothermothrix orenii (strain H 168 / OCM 544 / DSM 9562) TaxID=373903 RepID=B8D1F5_HALOH|nr:FeoB small GTPase domain-containing protein [Halothermothrix orenii]ACL69032.1 Ferrous iron transport protein FeoB [Halothermothrix orenii H 168]
MGLTAESSGLNVLKEEFNIELDKKIPVIALAGNPNTGKSTVFNGLTGLRQHTGNWPGKTVTRARGFFTHKDQEFMIVDLPGTYSLLASSTEERIARDFICFARPDTTVVVADATNLERNLNLVLQVTELTSNVILCLNLMDEARRKNIKIDIKELKNNLKIPVIPTVARDGIGLENIKEMVYKITNGDIKVNPGKVKYSPEIEEAVDRIVPVLKKNFGHISDINLKWLALRLIEGDKTIMESIEKYVLRSKPEFNLSAKREV